MPLSHASSSTSFNTNTSDEVNRDGEDEERGKKKGGRNATEREGRMRKAEVKSDGLVD